MLNLSLPNWLVQMKEVINRRGKKEKKFQQRGDSNPSPVDPQTLLLPLDHQGLLGMFHKFTFLNCKLGNFVPGYFVIFIPGNFVPGEIVFYLEIYILFENLLVMFVL